MYTSGEIYHVCVRIVPLKIKFKKKKKRREASSGHSNIMHRYNMPSADNKKEITIHIVTEEHTHFAHT